MKGNLFTFQPICYFCPGGPKTKFRLPYLNQSLKGSSYRWLAAMMGLHSCNFDVSKSEDVFISIICFIRKFLFWMIWDTMVWIKYSKIKKQVSNIVTKLRQYKIFHYDNNTIRYRINYLKVGIFNIDTKIF